MKDRNGLETRVIRSLVAAIDNAEAPALPLERTVPVQHQFANGSAEITRLQLDRAQVQAILVTELQERERAAAEFDRLELPDRAAILRAEASVIKQYLD